jgi:hypothetical protein
LIEFGVKICSSVVAVTVAVLLCGYGDSTLCASVAAAILLLAFFSLHLAAPVSVFGDPEGIVAPVAATGGVEEVSAIGDFGMCNYHTLTLSSEWWWFFIFNFFDEEAEGEGGAM